MLGGSRQRPLDVPVDLEQLLIDRTAQRQTLGTFRQVADAGRFFEGIFAFSPVVELANPRVPTPAVASRSPLTGTGAIPNPQVTVGR